MRTALLVFGTAALLICGFVAYWFMQPDNVARNHAADAAPIKAEPIPDAESTYTVKGGKRVWLKEFDADRRMTNRFSAEEFVPQKEGFVRVTKPEAHFFLRGGQWIRVTGETGDVIISGMPEQGSDAFTAGGGASMGSAPSRGHLLNVRIQFYETAAAPEPTLDLTMANAAFDNESFRIFTEGYTDKDGTVIAADQVKVSVRGKYEFDGRGLTIRWNDRDRRLELLEVAHGERLLVKDPGAIGTELPGKKKSKDKQQKARASFDNTTFATDALRSRLTSAMSPLPLAFASADPAAAVAAAAKDANAGATTKPASTLYSIWFYDNVRVEQSGKTLARGNVIEVFYAMRESPDEPAATEPAPVAQPAPVSPDAQAAKPQAAVDSSAPPAAPTSQPAPAPQEPVAIYWTGRLRIVPSETEPPGELAPGDSAVQMRGSPVLLTRDNLEIRCPAFTYRTADERVMLHTSQTSPRVEIKQFANIERTGDPEMTLTSEWVEYAPGDGVATLGGESKAIFPADETGKSREMAEARWTREGVARFTGAGNETVISSLQLAGDVDVRHPQLTLKSQQLDLAFDPPAPMPEDTAKVAGATTKPSQRQPTVREVIAQGAARCVLIDEEGATQELNGEHLVIATAKDPAGKIYPKQVNAKGKVKAIQMGSELAAEELAVELVPAKPKPVDPKKDAKAVAANKPGAKPKNASAGSPSVELQRLTAKTNVRAVSDKGDVATGDTLVVTPGPDGKPQVGLSGNPASVANAAGTVLTSERIAIPNGDEAHAMGPGTLHALVEDKDPKAPKRFMDVNWSESAVLNSKLDENQVQVSGKVRASMPDADGTVHTANADRILITLVDVPPKPAAPGAAVAPAVKQPKEKDADGGALASTEVDVMKGKQVSRVLLTKDAVVDSRLTDVDGTVLREMRVDSSAIAYDMLAQRLIVPRPGRMIVRDHRPPEPTDAKPADQDGLAGNRGATAFQWDKSLDYNGSEQIAKMTGGVIVAYKPDEAGELPVRLRANEVIASFEDAQKPKPGTATPPVAPTPKTGLDAKMPAVQLRSVRAEGDVNVVRGTDELTAPRLTYDPVTHWIRAIGTEAAPAVYTPGGRGASTTAREFQWNTQTWKIRIVDASGRTAAGR